MKPLAYALGALTVLLAAPGSFVAVVFHPGGDDDVMVGVVFGLLAVAGAVTGTLVATRAPANAVGWLILLQGLGMGLTLGLGLYASAGLHEPGAGTPHAVAGWWADLFGSTAPLAPTGLLLLVFPTGRFSSRGWGVLAGLFLVAVVTATSGSLLLADTVGPGLENPFRVSGSTEDLIHHVVAIAGICAGPAAVGCVLSLFLRLRGSAGRERQRVKWIAYSATVGVVGFALALLLRGPVGDLAWAVALVNVALLPVSMGIAILRHRLFDIDVVIKRTLVYSVLTVTLLATYLLLVLVLQLLLRAVAGDSDLAVAGSTLVVAALFGPLRRVVQRSVDRRFFRSRYDAARTLDAFVEHLRDEVDLTALGNDLQLVVADTMQPEHVSLWLREEL